MMSRNTWNWRSHLTDAERAAVRRYDEAMERVRKAQDAADKYRLELIRIRNRAVQRAKFRAANPDAKRRERAAS